MNKLHIPLVLVLLVIVFVSGCANTVETGQERSWRIAQGFKLDRRMLQDDLDYIFLINHNSTLSQYHQRLGF